MQSIPFFEAKNKLPLYIHMVGQGESFEITRHGKPLAYLVSKDEKKEEPQIDKFELILKHWKEKYSDCFLSEEEEKECFETPRKTTTLRNLQDFDS